MRENEPDHEWTRFGCGLLAAVLMVFAFASGSVIVAAMAACFLVLALIASGGPRR